MEVLLQTHQPQAKDLILLMLQAPNRIVLDKILIVPEVLHKMAPIHQILEQVQVHRVQQPEPRIEVETCPQPRLLNLLLRMLIQMLTVQSVIM